MHFSGSSSHPHPGRLTGRPATPEDPTQPVGRGETTPARATGQGVIVPSQSEYTSPIVLVRTKNGALRLCVVAKCLRDRYPFSRIEESLNVLSGAKHFFTTDLAAASNQLLSGNRHFDGRLGRLQTGPATCGSLLD